MRKVITINIPEPCYEDWNKMTPKDKGRHCASCNKTVVDFTKQTDEQIIKTLESKGNQENLCGRFKKQQIDREVVLARKDKNNYLSIAASGLLAFMALGNQNAFAEGSPTPIQTEAKLKPMFKGKVATSVLLKKVISGTVTDASNNTPLPNVNVIIKGSAKSVKTDLNGKFTIKVKKGDTLVFSHLGYDFKEITIKNTSKINVELSQNKLEVLGEISVAGGIRFNYVEENTNTEAPKQNNLKNNKQERTAFGKFFFGIKRLFSKK